MQSIFRALMSQAIESTWQITAANRRPGYEKNVHRIQGFVFGVLFITIINLVGELLFNLHPRDSKALATAWATAVLVACDG